jgi:GAF domain
MADGPKPPPIQPPVQRDVPPAGAERPQDLLAQNGKLRWSLTELQRQHRELVERFTEIESHNRALESLFVTAYQLHASLVPAEVLATLEEILVNLIGAERFDVWATSSAGEPMERLLDSQGMRGFRPLTRDERSTARAVLESGPWFSEDDPREGVDALVIVPLRAGAESVGVLFIRKFLEHKTGINQTDSRVIGLLADQAGTALLSAKLHAARGRPA